MQIEVLHLTISVLPNTVSAQPHAHDRGGVLNNPTSPGKPGDGPGGLLKPRGVHSQLFETGRQRTHQRDDQELTLSTQRGEQRKAPVFVGGTGRSGTTITARVLGSHPSLHMVPIEVRFIVEPGGLCDLLAGKTDFGEFAASIKGKWWYRELPDGSTRGLHKLISERLLDDALNSLRREDALAPPAARGFVHSILDPLLDEADASRWVEMTPPNVLRGGELLRVFPDMKLIHVVRDGRDVACSVASLGWGPNDPLSALDWWADRLQNAHKACQALSNDRLMEIRIEDLIMTPEQAAERLQVFVGEEADMSVIRFVNRWVTEERAHIGRWRTEIASQQRQEFQRHYLSLVNRLEKEGVPTLRLGLT